MSRIFLSHSSKDLREAIALKRWLAQQDATLEDEIFLDAGSLRPGMRWKEALRRANARCEAVICLLSRNWEASSECETEYRTAENLNKQILCARLEPSTGEGLISEWQRCDLFGDGPTTDVDIADGTPVRFATEGLLQLREAIGEAGIGPESFPWPPQSDPDRAPYRGWQPLEPMDAAVFFGRDAAIVRAMDSIRGMRLSGLKSLFVVLGPSGTGKSSFLRAGLLPRLAREDRRFVLLDIVRPERNAITGDTGLATAIDGTRKRFGLDGASLGDIKKACAGGETNRVAQWLSEIRHAAATQLLADFEADGAPAPPTLILPLDQAEELFSADAGLQAEQFIALIRDLARTLNDPESDAGLIVLCTIRTDRYEVMQTHPTLAGVEALVFDELKPMPVEQFTEVITGPARRATKSGHALKISPELRDRLLHDASQGADTLPMLSLTLSRLFNDYGSAGTLTVEQYESMGGMRQVVQTEIDEVLATDPERRRDQLSLLRTAFIPWLATVNPDNDQPMRRVARYAELPKASTPLIDALVAKRLMVKGTRDGEVVVEVALESLLRQWEELAGWLREERHDLQAADDLERAASAWQTSGHDAAWLLTGTRLTDAESLVAKAVFRRRLASAHDYLAASRDAENERLRAEDERREAELVAAEERAKHAQERQATAEAHAVALRKRSRVLRAVVALTTVVAVGAAVALGFALIAHNQAQSRFEEATAVRLVAEAQDILDGTRPGSEARALQQLLIANAMRPNTFGAVLHSAAVKTFDTEKIIESSGPILEVAISPDGRRFVTGGDGPTLALWDAQTGRQLDTMFNGHTAGANGVAFSADGRRIVSASDDRTVRLWDADTGRQIGEPMTGHEGEVWTVAFSPDQRMIASGGTDATVRLWDADTGRPLGPPLTGHTDAVQDISFSPDGSLIASGGSDNTVRLWDVATRREVRPPLVHPEQEGETGEVIAVVFSPDGRRLASAGGDNLVRLWDVESGQPIGQPLAGHGTTVLGLAFSPDGLRIASSASDGVILLWNAQTGESLGDPLTGHHAGVWSVAFNADGSRLVSASEGGEIRVWNIDIGQPLTGHTAGISKVAFSPDGRRIASVSDDRTVRLWDANNGRPVGGALVGHSEAVTDVAFSVSDGRRLATAGADGTVRFWDAATGNPIGTPLDARQGPLTSIAFSPDGARLATAGGNTVRMWSAATGAPLGAPITTHEHEAHSQRGPFLGRQDVAFNADGSRFASVSDDGDLALWNAEDGSLIEEVPVANALGGLYTIAFSPKGRVLATAGVGGIIELRDADTLQPVGEPFEGHEDTIYAVAFSADGRRIASASGDEGIRLWDTETGEQITEPLTGHTGNVTGVAFSPDGRFLVSGGDDGTVRLWPATAGPADLCAKLTANMSRKQWDDWVSPDIDYIEACPDLPIAPTR